MTSRSAVPAGVGRLSWLLLVLAVLASAALIRESGRARSKLRAEVDVTLAVPAGPALLVTLDVAALPPRTTRELLGAGQGKLLGLRELCGFEPLLGLRQLALVMPVASAGEGADFALLATTNLEPEPVLRCAEAVIRKRGGAPVRSQLADFDSVRDRSKPLGELAIRKDGLLVLSGGNYFRAVVDAASGAEAPDEAARLRNMMHANVRRKLGSNQLLLSALGGAVPLPGVQVVGVGLSVGRDVQVRGAIYCAAAAECHRAAELMRSLVAELAPATGLSKLQLVEQGAELKLAGRLELTELLRLGERWLEP
jgi:hypothetical protein